MLNIQKNISLAQYSTFKIGGPAKCFVEVKNEEELIEALKYARENNLEVFVLGGGSNVLFSDAGFDGLVIKLEIKNYKIKIDTMECGAGLLFSEAVKIAKDNSLSGLEWAVGIPGTIGGAIRGNAGAYGSDMSEVIESVKVYCHSRADGNPIKKTERIKIFDNSDCQFSYRNSIFKENNNFIILSCVLKLAKGNKMEIENKVMDILEKRRGGHPQGFSAGSFFKNPTVNSQELKEEFENEKKIKCKDGKIPAAWIIEKAGLKDQKIGGAMVSEKHANFIINTGKAKAEDIVILAGLIKEKVRNEFGVELMEEINYVGF